MAASRCFGLLVLCLLPAACATAEPALVIRGRLTSLHGPAETACETTVIGANDRRLVARYTGHYRLQAREHENLRARLPVPAGGPYRVTIRCIGSERVFESEAFSLPGASGAEGLDLGRIEF